MKDSKNENVAASFWCTIQSLYSYPSLAIIHSRLFYAKGNFSQKSFSYIFSGPSERWSGAHLLSSIFWRKLHLFQQLMPHNPFSFIFVYSILEQRVWAKKAITHKMLGKIPRLQYWKIVRNGLTFLLRKISWIGWKWDFSSGDYLTLCDLLLCSSGWEEHLSNLRQIPSRLK